LSLPCDAVSQSAVGYLIDFACPRIQRFVPANLMTTLRRIKAALALLP
jgi:hypothetical protein